MARTATNPLRSTVNVTPRSPFALAKSKPSIFQNLAFVAQLQFCLRQLQRKSSHRMASCENSGLQIVKALVFETVNKLDRKPFHFKPEPSLEPHSL